VSEWEADDLTEAEIRRELARIAALPPDEMTMHLALRSSSLRSNLAIIARARIPVPAAPEGN
jgi:hypothetical protein